MIAKLIDRVSGLLGFYVYPQPLRNGPVWRPEDGEGWQPAMPGIIPYSQTVEFHSIWQHSGFFSKWCELHPMFNVDGLYWRYP